MWSWARWHFWTYPPWERFGNCAVSVRAVSMKMPASSEHKAQLTKYLSFQRNRFSCKQALRVRCLSNAINKQTWKKHDVNPTISNCYPTTRSVYAVFGGVGRNNGENWIGWNQRSKASKLVISGAVRRREHIVAFLPSSHFIVLLGLWSDLWGSPEGDTGGFPSLLVGFCFLSVGTKDVGEVRRRCGDSSPQPQLQTPRTPELPHFEKKNEKTFKYSVSQ